MLTGATFDIDGGQQLVQQCSRQVLTLVAGVGFPRKTATCKGGRR